MLNPFQEPRKIEVRRFTSLPAKYRRKRRTAWSDPNRQGAALDSFLEGPSFDRQGNLWCVDIPFGRIFRINSKAEWQLVTQYDGWPNGLKIHRDGRIFIADYKRGLMILDPRTGKIEPRLETAFSEGFKGLNDLHFADNGDLYFTDQGQSGIADPTGRVWRLRANGELLKLVTNAPSPNGITLNKKNNQVYVALTRGGQYRNTPSDTQVPYLKTVFTFLGMTEVQFVYAEGLAMGPDAERNAITSAHEQIEEALAA